MTVSPELKSLPLLLLRHADRLRPTLVAHAAHPRQDGHLTAICSKNVAQYNLWVQQQPLLLPNRLLCQLSNLTPPQRSCVALMVHSTWPVTALAILSYGQAPASKLPAGGVIAIRWRRDCRWRRVATPRLLPAADGATARDGRLAVESARRLCCGSAAIFKRGCAIGSSCRSIDPLHGEAQNGGHLFGDHLAVALGVGQCAEVREFLQERNTQHAHAGEFCAVRSPSACIMRKKNDISDSNPQTNKIAWRKAASEVGHLEVLQVRRV